MTSVQDKRCSLPASMLLAREGLEEGECQGREVRGKEEHLTASWDECNVSEARVIPGFLGFSTEYQVPEKS